LKVRDLERVFLIGLLNSFLHFFGTRIYQIRLRETLINTDFFILLSNIFFNVKCFLNADLTDSLTRNAN
jgi:hypothetical protein